MIDLTDTIQAKSDQLNADDLIGVDKVIKVTDVKLINDKQQPVIIHYEGDCGRPFKPCLGVRRMLVACWGKDGSQYIGRSMKLYNNPNVRYGGKDVGGIRVSEVSHIERPVSINIAIARGKKEITTINPLVVNENKPAWPDDKLNAQLEKATPAILGGTSTHEQVINKLESKATLSDEQKERIRAIGEDNGDDITIDASDFYE